MLDQDRAAESAHPAVFETETWSRITVEDSDGATVSVVEVMTVPSPSPGTITDAIGSSDLIDPELIYTTAAEVIAGDVTRWTLHVIDRIDDIYPTAGQSAGIGAAEAFAIFARDLDDESIVLTTAHLQHDDAGWRRPSLSVMQEWAAHNFIPHDKSGLVLMFR